MNIQLDTETMKAIAADAILKSIDQTGRDALIKGAIEHLMTAPPRDRHDYSSRPVLTPLQEAFNSAVLLVARKTVQEMLAGDETIAAKVREMGAAAVAKWVSDEATVHRMACAISDALMRSDR